MANGKTWNPNTRMYEAIDFDRQPEVKDDYLTWRDGRAEQIKQTK